MILDEVQSAPDLLSYIQGMVDEKNISIVGRSAINNGSNARAIDSVLGDRIIEKSIIYAGEFEDNITSRMKLLNFKNMHSIL